MTFGNKELEAKARALPADVQAALALQNEAIAKSFSKVTTLNPKPYLPAPSTLGLIGNIYEIFFVYRVVLALGGWYRF